MFVTDAPESMNRQQRRRIKRRAGGLVGASLFAATGLLGGYVGNPRLPRAYATGSCTVQNSNDLDGTGSTVLGSLRYCLEQVASSGVDSIAFSVATDTIPIALNDDLPVVNSSVTIVGNGRGVTVIDGGGYYSALYFHTDGAALEARVSALTITDTVANRDLGSSYTYGGAIFGYVDTHDLDLHVTDVEFTGNAADWGGAISLEGGYNSANGALVVTDSTFDSNTASNGAAIDFYLGTNDDTLSIVGSTFTNNQASEDGGAVFSYGTTTISEDSTFTSNRASFSGGAVFVKDFGITIDAATFDGNYAQDEGGAVYAGGNTDISYSTFSGNGIGSTGFTNVGGAIRAYGDATITYSLFVGNDTDSQAGALDAEYQTTITNSTFSGNGVDTSGPGGAVHSRLGAVIRFSTFMDNGNMNAVGGGLYAYDGDVVIENSIFYGNVADSYDDVYLNDYSGVSTFTAGYTFFSNSAVNGAYPVPTTATSLWPAVDPMVASLSDNGGPTQTMMPRTGSPAIGAASSGGTVALDQRGFARSTPLTVGAAQPDAIRPAPDVSQLPPSWRQATQRQTADEPCPVGMNPSWAEWPNSGTGGWTCEMTTWWDVNKGSRGDWVTTPGLRKLELSAKSSWSVLPR